MPTIAEEIKESRKILDDLYEDLDSYEILFESEIMDNDVKDIDSNKILDDLIELRDKFNSYMSTNKNPDFAEGEESGFLSASEQIERIIIKYRKDFYG